MLIRESEKGRETAKAVERTTSTDELVLQYRKRKTLQKARPPHPRNASEAVQ